MTDSVRVGIYHDKRSKLKPKTKKEEILPRSPVKLSLIHDGVTEFFSTGISMDIKDYEKYLTNKNLPNHLQEARDKISNLKTKANEVIGNLEYFDLGEFRHRMTGKEIKNKDLIAAIQARKDDFSNADEGSSEGLQMTLINNLRIFEGNKKAIPFKKVTPAYLKSLETYWKNGKPETENKKAVPPKSINTIARYMSNIKAAFSYAHDEKWIPEVVNPFAKSTQNKRKYHIRTEATKRKALSPAQIAKIEKYSEEHSGNRWVDYFLFSYYANGINIIDALQLTEDNIDDDYLFFSREKTKKAKTVLTIGVEITPQIRAIIDRYKDDTHLLPGLRDITDVRRHPDYINKTISKKQLLKIDAGNINRNINNFLSKVLYTKAEIKKGKRCAPIMARHSYATHAIFDNVSIYEVAQNLGHSSVIMTENYLSTFVEYLKWKNKNRR